MAIKDKYALEFSRGQFIELPPHPESCDLDDVGDYARRQDRPLAIDLFCGAGGLSLGLKQAGFSVVLQRSPSRVPLRR